ncbi:hypothetical protein NHX12_003408, partial [Muraenolepis orangiensis]
MGGNGPSQFANEGDGEAGGVSFVKGIRKRSSLPKTSSTSAPSPCTVCSACFNTTGICHYSRYPHLACPGTDPCLNAYRCPASVVFAPAAAPSVEDEIAAGPVLSFEPVGPTCPAGIDDGQSVCISQSPDSGRPPLTAPFQPCHSMEVALPNPGSAAAESQAEPMELDPPALASLNAEPQVPKGSTSLPVAENPFPVFVLRPLPVPLVQVDVEELRRKIKEELQQQLDEEISQKRGELQLQLEEVRARTRAEALAAAQVVIQEQVKQTLSAEKTEHLEKLRNALLTERMKSDDERLIAQLYWLDMKAHKLDEKERALREQDERFKEHLTRLEEKSQVMNCYKDNEGKTLSCSSIAAAYMKCVADTKLQ